MSALPIASNDQVRLGWLVPIAAFVGAQRRAVADIEGFLHEVAPRQPEWCAVAGIDRAPFGQITKSRGDRVARMGVTFGIYDPNRESLTDLGHLLRLTSGTDGEAGALGDSVFVWSGVKRMIGLRIILGAMGGAFLAIVRGWPRSGAGVLTMAEAPDFVAGALATLEGEARGDERERLREQVARAKNPRTGLRNLAYPYLEPLRDLGYLRLTADGYVLSLAGERIRRFLGEEFSGGAESLIASGFSRLWLCGEGVEVTSPGLLQDLTAALSSIPEPLLVSDQEVELESLLLLLQIRLFEVSPGRWVDVAILNSLIQELRVRSQGGVFTKHSGRRFPNLGWVADLDCLEGSGADSEGIETVAVSSAPGAQSSAGRDVEGGAALYASELVPACSSAANEASDEGPVRTEEGAVIRPPRELQWLQFVEAFARSLEGLAVQDSAPGQCLGILGTLRHLHRLTYHSEGALRERRAVASPAKKSEKAKGEKPRIWSLALAGAAPYFEVLMRSDGADDVSCLAGRVVNVWETHPQQPSAPRERVRAVIERLLRRDVAIRERFGGLIRSYVCSDEAVEFGQAWRDVAAATRSLVLDAVALSARSLPEVLLWTQSKGAAAILADLVDSAAECCHKGEKTWVVSTGLISDLERSTRRDDGAGGGFTAVPEHFWGDRAAPSSSHQPSDHLRFQASPPQSDGEGGAQAPATVTFSWQLHGASREQAERRALRAIDCYLSMVSPEHAFSRRDEVPAPFPGDGLRARTAESLGVVALREGGVGWSQPRFRELSLFRPGRDGGYAQVSGALHRLALGARGGQITATSKVLETWVALEQLVTGSAGEVRHGAWLEVLDIVSECAAVAVTRAHVVRVLTDVVVALIADFVCDPGMASPEAKRQLRALLARFALDGVADCVLAELPPSSIRVARLHARSLFAWQVDKRSLLRAGAARSVTYADAEEVRRRVVSRYPHVATELMALFEDGATAAAQLGVARLVSDHQASIRSLLGYLYDLRNRIVHEGYWIEAHEDEHAAGLVLRVRALMYPLLARLVRVSSSSGGSDGSLMSAWAFMREDYEDLRARGALASVFAEESESSDDPADE